MARHFFITQLINTPQTLVLFFINTIGSNQVVILECPYTSRSTWCTISLQSLASDLDNSMQLSFSIDAILGTNNKTSRNERGVFKNKNQEEIREQHTTKRTSILKEKEGSPRSHTIEWKPYGRESNLPRSIPSQHRNEMSRKYSGDGAKPVLRSPPNASVIPSYSKCDKVTKDSCPHQKIKDSFSKRNQNFDPTQIHLGVSQLFPYPMDFIRSRSVYHHPHHYPYQLPFVSHGCSVPSRSFPGLFSPNYSAPSMAHAQKNDRLKYGEQSENFRVSQLSGENCDSNLPSAESTTAAHSGMYYWRLWSYLIYMICRIW